MDNLLGSSTNMSSSSAIALATSLHEKMINDVDEFHLLRDHMFAIGFPSEDIDLIFQTIAGILHLGQITFKSVIDANINEEGRTGRCA
jgi:myosin heavy subunit